MESLRIAHKNSVFYSNLLYQRHFLGIFITFFHKIASGLPRPAPKPSLPPASPPHTPLPAYGSARLLLQSRTPLPQTPCAGHTATAYIHGSQTCYVAVLAPTRHSGDTTPTRAFQKILQKKAQMFWRIKSLPYLCTRNPIETTARRDCNVQRQQRPNAEIAQLVEHNLAKVGVASSSLVFRSRGSPQ